jgi:hypothetical protein
VLSPDGQGVVTVLLDGQQALFDRAAARAPVRGRARRP